MTYNKGNHGRNARRCGLGRNWCRSITNQFRNTPILETTVRKVASDDKWYFALRKFLDGDLKSVRLAVKGDKDGGVHAMQKKSVYLVEV
jgi:hypothetical protein